MSNYIVWYTYPNASQSLRYAVVRSLDGTFSGHFEDHPDVLTAKELHDVLCTNKLWNTTTVRQHKRILIIRAV